MPTDSTRRTGSGRLALADLRTLRLALGTAASLWFSQAIGWPLSFVAPVLTMFLLALPLPCIKPKAGAALVLVLTGSMYLSALLLLPAITYQPAVGLVLLVLALYWTFYYTAKGGSPMLGTFATIGIALSTAVGSVSIDAVFMLTAGLGVAAAVGIVFVMLAHRLLPDDSAADAPAPGAAGKPSPEPPDPARARWSALRSLLIVFPVAYWLLLSPTSTASIPVMLKVASMGQQATNENTRVAARSLIASTLIGGAGAIIGWQVLSVMPTLTLYTLVIAIAGLVMGRRVFEGQALSAEGATWSYAFLTMIVILAPAVTDGMGGGPAGAKFVDRLIMFLGTAVYAVVAVYVTDAFRPRRIRREETVSG